MIFLQLFLDFSVLTDCNKKRGLPFWDSPLSIMDGIFVWNQSIEIVYTLALLLILLDHLLQVLEVGRIDTVFEFGSL